MTKKFCDKCGVKITITTFKVKTYIETDWNFNNKKVKTFDVCKKCFNDINNSFKNNL